MDISSKPMNLTMRWAQDATSTYVRDVPLSSVDPVAASFALGFPPDTFVDVSAGGTPPDGRDMNGAFQIMSDWVRWLSLGGQIAYDAAFQTAVGGYPLGSVVAGTTAGTFYRSTTNNNVTNPNTGGAGWVPAFGGSSIVNGSITNAALANMAADRVKGRLSTTGSPQDLTGAQVTTLLSPFNSSTQGVVPASGGNASLPLLASGSFGALSNSGMANMASDRIKGRLSSTGSPQDLTPAQVAAILPEFTSGAKGLAPAAGGNASLPLLAGGSFAALPNAGMADMTASRFKGRTGSTGSPQDLTPAQATALLDAFTTSLKGLVPAGGGNPLLALLASGSFGQVNYAVIDDDFFTNANGYSFRIGRAHIQMGVASGISPDTTRTITFPVAFSGAPQWFNVGGRRATFSATSDYVMEVIGTPGSTSMVVANNNVNNTPTADATWIAVRFT